MATILWYPDICPGGQCVISEQSDGVKTGFVSACAHHRGQRTSLGDAGTFAAMAASCRAKEKAREVVMQQLSLIEAPRYRVESNGTISVISGRSGGTLSSLRTAVTNATSAHTSVPGCASVTVVT